MTIASTVVVAGTVITTELLWPWTASAIHDGVNVIQVVATAALLSIRRLNAARCSGAASPTKSAIGHAAVTRAIADTTAARRSAAIS